MKMRLEQRQGGSQASDSDSDLMHTLGIAPLGRSDIGN